MYTMRCPAFAATLALAACSTAYSPRSLAPGTTEAAAVQAMGAPTGQSVLPEGGKRLEFARGPFGKETYMLDFDAQGRMLRWEQVLTEQNFAKIKAGMDKSEVLAMLGRPSEISGYGVHEKRQAWSYRYDSPFCVWFQIGMTLQGTVVDSAYNQDPLCERRDRR
jgi:outer membrane protein assembly factor BamE (lipoprotein component of BamABCDE complex)